ncbi:MAG TPA: SDR family oxidoreductase [Acidimicrobiales bacterium]|jgi:NAD(P)-dependent dehydrogenase (short-subunit alcohol dehydrogenase family)|nr:SDR family oxidoreductase [Acidimicrobiales bacterium]
MRTVVVGASSGLGRCIGVGLTQRGARTALLARRLERLEAAAKEAGPGTLALACDVTDTESCRSAINEAAEQLGGLDALVYTPAIGPLAGLVDMDAQTWRRVFDTNVIGASLVTAAALPHLAATNGVALYLSSVSASLTPPWPGLGAYAVSKAALDKLVEAWRAEHPAVGFTRVIVGDCAGGEGDSMTGFANDWDHDRAVEFGTKWAERKYLSDSLIEVDELVTVIDSLIRHGQSLSLHSVTVAPRTVPGAPPPPKLELELDPQGS